jgi:signal transduction histidine kinase
MQSLIRPHRRILVKLSAQPSSQGVTIQDLVNSDLVDLLFVGTGIELPNAAATAVTAFVWYGAIPTAALAVWIGFRIVVQISRFLLQRSYRLRRNKIPISTWLRRYRFSKFLSGIGWGSLGGFLVASPDAGLHTYVLIVLVGLASCSATYQCRDVRATDLYLWSAISPAALAWLTWMDKTHFAMAGMAAVFVVAQSILARRAHHVIVETLTAKHERANLATQLRVANDQFKDVNRRLEESNAELVEARKKAEAFSRAKSEFLANMSHELRTPLNAILGFSDLMAAKLFGPLGHPNYEGYIRDIHGAGQHLLLLINDALDLSKIEAQKLRLDEAVVDLTAAVQSWVRVLSPRATQANVEIEVEVDGYVPAVVADEIRMRQIGLNLLSNAVKFTPRAGKVVIALRLTSQGEVELTVRDSGIGMAPEDIPKAFEPFGQVGPSSPRQQEGTGLGLPITKMLVELHGGRISMRSSKGAGTTVTVLLPQSRIIGNISTCENRVASIN